MHILKRRSLRRNGLHCRRKAGQFAGALIATLALLTLCPANADVGNHKDIETRRILGIHGPGGKFHIVQSTADLWVADLQTPKGSQLEIQLVLGKDDEVVQETALLRQVRGESLGGLGAYTDQSKALVSLLFGDSIGKDYDGSKKTEKSKIGWGSSVGTAKEHDAEMHSVGNYDALMFIYKSYPEYGEEQLTVQQS